MNHIMEVDLAPLFAYDWFIPHDNDFKPYADMYLKDTIRRAQGGELFNRGCRLAGRDAEDCQARTLTVFYKEGVIR